MLLATDQDNRPGGILGEAARKLLDSRTGKALLSRIEEGGQANLTGLPDPAKSFLIASLLEVTGRPGVVLVPDEARARALAQELSAFMEEEGLLTFHGRELSLTDVRAVNRQLELERAAVMARLLAGDYQVLILPADAALQRLRLPGIFGSFSIHLARGQELDPQLLERKLLASGYERVPQVDSPGQYARRGDILDVWAAGQLEGKPRAVRLSFFDIQVDELKILDPDSQRSSAVLEAVDLPPARELPLLEAEWEETALRIQALLDQELDQLTPGLGHRERTHLKGSLEGDRERLDQRIFFPALDRWLPLFESSQTTILDYLPGGQTLYFLDEPLTFSRRMDAAHAGFANRLTGYLERGEALPLSMDCQLTPADLFRLIDQKQSFLALVDLPHSGNGLPSALPLAFRARLSDSYKNKPDRLADQMLKIQDKQGAALLYTGSDERAQSLSAFLAERDIFTPYVMTRDLSRGFIFPDESILVAGSGDLFGISRLKRQTRRRSKREVFFKDLTPGSLVVHEDYGVGEYLGTEMIATSDGERDYLTVSYRDGLLHLPVDRVDLLTPYIPVGDKAPKLSKLGGVEWQRQKERARASIKKLVTDITSLYAERRAIKGHVYAADTPWQAEFEAAFPYEETEDQVRVLQEIKADMESDKVMDRLLCGDVGFGKTELCFRAMFKCVMEGKQAALLAPTTVLVRQHYNNLLERLEGFPVKARQLSRFVSDEAQKETIKGLARGEIDMVVATHRLLSKDVRFRDLGLLVIDEEQRFGVDHKEMIKALSPSVEVLSLSATPIPRTLHFSLSGIRDISLLEEGPEDRLPVHTSVMEYSEDLVLDAILREQARHGQVFYLYNNTHKIDRRAHELAEKLPGVRFAVAHAKLSERRLEEVIEAFVAGDYDVLVCTTIIESGIDMPHVNTLIVEDADRLGLAQLYQLRGRVGRSDRQAYALITYNPDRVIGEAAQKRLAAIRDFTELGSGFQIALRDLEVRGAGSLLGAEQSGHLEAIGYDLYSKMLEEAVIEERGEKLPEKKAATLVDLTTDAVLPPLYVKESAERLEVYRRIASIRHIGDYRDVYDELLDRYGDPPAEALALLDISYIRAFGERAGFSRIRARADDLELLLSQDASEGMDLIARLMASAGEDYPLSFKAGYRPLIRMSGGARKPSASPALLRELFAGADSYS